MHKVFQWSHPVDLSVMQFSGGERHVRLGPCRPEKFAPWTIVADVRNPADLIDLLLIRDAISHEAPGESIHLRLPYLPYARQDRACHRGEAFSLHVLGQLLNGAGFASIEVWDVHSDVAFQEVEHLRSRPASDFLKGLIRPGEFIVAPDHGAFGRARAVADDAKADVLQMTKKRNPEDGSLGRFELETDLSGRDTAAGAIIVDDICDGGRTFIGAAGVLRAHITGPLRLYVTHGIFSAGFDQLGEVFDEILVANIMTDEPLPDFVHLVGGN